MGGVSRGRISDDRYDTAPQPRKKFKKGFDYGQN